MRRSSFVLFAPFFFAALTFPQMSKAQNSGETASKPVQMIIGFGSGGGYDLWGRSVARHMGRHLPGKPTMIAQNMPGAGSFAAANYIYNIAPKDGSVLALIARDAPLGPLVGVDGARFDPRKLSWIGTSAKETNVCVSYHTAAVKTIEDLYTKQLIIGDSGAGDGTYIYPRALIDLLGLKFKQVSGFPSSSDVILAMERGEVEAICESLDSVKAPRESIFFFKALYSQIRNCRMCLSHSIWQKTMILA
jgi:tripartite-type tricarboxylate transporter receptor subunit TctC